MIVVVEIFVFSDFCFFLERVHICDFESFINSLTFILVLFKVHFIIGSVKFLGRVVILIQDIDEPLDEMLHSKLIAIVRKFRGHPLYL